MFHHINACVTSCLASCLTSCVTSPQEGPEVEEESTEDTAGRREAGSVGHAGSAGARAGLAGVASGTGAAGASGGAQASAHAQPAADFIEDVQRDLQQVQAWPRSAKLLGMLGTGRELICMAGRREWVDPALKQCWDAWQHDLRRFKDAWAQLQTLPTEPLNPWQAPRRALLPQDRQDYVDEQLLYARQDLALARQAFGEERFNAAIVLDARAGQHLLRARQLTNVFSRLPDAGQTELIQLLEQGRAQDDFSDADTRLQQLCQDGLLPIADPLRSDLRPSVTSSEGDERPAAGADLAKSLRALKQDAKELPSRQRLRPWFLAQCTVLERALQQAPKSSPTDEVRQQLSQMETLLRANKVVRAQMDKVAQQMSEVEVAARTLPSLNLRLIDADTRMRRLRAAYDAEDYESAAQIFEEAMHVGTATLALSKSGQDDEDLRRIFEHRNQQVAFADPWLRRVPTTYMDRLLHNHFKQMLSMFDKVSDRELLHKGMYELETAARNLQSPSRVPAFIPTAPAGLPGSSVN